MAQRKLTFIVAIGGMAVGIVAGVLSALLLRSAYWQAVVTFGVVFTYIAFSMGPARRATERLS